MDELFENVPGGGVLIAVAALVTIPPLRRRVVPVARAVARGGAGVAGAFVSGVTEVVNSAVRGETNGQLPKRKPATKRS